jgi:Molybdenum cofactor biosynthesis enzyme
MPASGVAKKRHEDMITFEEIIYAVEAAAELGIKKIRVTGGEPLVRRGIVDLCRGISSVDGIDELCMTTNGTLLYEYAADLKMAGVDRLNISLDTLDSKKFRDITRIGDIGEVFRGLEAAEKAGFENTKINTVLINDFNTDEIRDMAELTLNRDLDVRFIELMPIGGGISMEENGYVSNRIVLEKLPELIDISGTDGVASMYALPNARGRIGLISPVSCSFCGSCNKIRLTADGKIKPCLNTDREIKIKGLTKNEMKYVMEQAILEKPEKGIKIDRFNPSKAGRNMNQIGG